jgi:hypothetical protein
MCKKLGILVHPGWVASEEKDKYDHIQYKTFLSNYDKAIVFLPELQRDFGKYLVIKFKKDITNYVLGLEYDERIKLWFRLDGVRKVLNVYVDHINKIAYKKIKLNGKMVLFRKTKMPPNILIEHLLEHKFDKIFDTNEKLGLLISGDQTWYPPTKNVINDFVKWYENSDSVHLVSYGGVDLVNANLENIFNTILGNEEYEIEVFGEYFNQCVKSVSYKLNKLGFEHKLIKSQSVFNMSIKEDYLKEQELGHYMYLSGCCDGKCTCKKD